MYCPKCGIENHDEAEFCTKCGIRLEQYSTPHAETVEMPSAPSGATGISESVTGKTVGGCRVEREVGRGGMGTVYYAEHISLEQPRAVKILPPALAADTTYLARFFKEAKSVAAIKHPNIVQVYDAGEFEGLYYFIMEFVDGKSLHALQKEKGPMPWRDVLRVLKQVLSAFEAAHRCNIIHRDIKPDNILLDASGNAMVADFGLAKNVSETTSLTRTGQVMGTPHYMSPEQCQGLPTDHRTDLYSLGATAYFMLTGKPVFNAETPLAILQMHCTREPEPVTSVVSDIPEGFAEILHRMLEKEKDDRYADATEALEAIEEFERTFDGTLGKTVKTGVAPKRRTGGDDGRKKPPAGSIRRKSRIPYLIPPIVVLILLIIIISRKHRENDQPGTPAGKSTAVTSLTATGVPASTAAAVTTGDNSSGTAPAEEPEDAEENLPRPEGVVTNSLGMEFVPIKAGAFIMGTDEGSEDEGPAHEVTISKEFYMQRTEVTQAQWNALMDHNPSAFKGDDLPVDSVSWADAVKFAVKLSMKEKARYRLPSEAEWEYACRAGTGGPYHFGNASEADEYCWFKENSGRSARPAASRKPNPWGLYDMQGNVWEWCRDWYSRFWYRRGESLDPTGPKLGARRVFRGGSWFDQADVLRATYRNNARARDSYSFLGFRLVMEK